MDRTDLESMDRKDAAITSLYIDADGFAGTESAVEIAAEFGVTAVVAGNATQHLGRFEDVEGIEVLEVSDGRDAADFAILNRIGRGDVLLTNDTGLAAVALAKGAVVMDARGNRFREETIEHRLMARHGAAKARRGGTRTKGPRRHSKEDRSRLENNLRGLLAALRSLR